MPLTGVNYHPKGHCSHLFSLETAYHHSFYFCLLQTVLGLSTESFIFNCWEIMFLRNITANVMQTRWPADKSHPCCLCRCRRPNFLSEFIKGSQWILFLLWVCYWLPFVTGRVSDVVFDKSHCDRREPKEWKCSRACEGLQPGESPGVGSAMTLPSNSFPRVPWLCRLLWRAVWALLFPLHRLQ